MITWGLGNALARVNAKKPEAKSFVIIFRTMGVRLRLNSQDQFCTAALSNINNHHMPQTRSKRQLRCQQRKTAFKRPISPIKLACSPINTGASSCEKHSNLGFRNRLTSINKTTSDTDLDNDFDQADFSQTSSQSSNLDAASNRLLGFSQTITKVRGTRTLASTNSSVNYALDANGNMTTDGLRKFDYDEANRLSTVKITKNGETAKVTYLHNAMGQRVFKSEPKLDTTLPNESTLGTPYIDWLKKNFAWLFAAAQANTSLGAAYSYGDEQLPSWALLGEYDNGSAKGAGRSEYIWLPTDDAIQAIPIGMFRNGRFFAVHPDHLGTPRLVSNDTNTPVWQWPYSAFGNNKPTGILKATTNPRGAITNNPVLLRATNATEFNLRFPGQYADSETGLFYNTMRSYCPGCGRYTQPDSIGLAGGWNRGVYVEGNPLMYTDPLGLNPVAGAIGGAQIGTAIFPGVGTVIGGVVGAGLGVLAGYGLDRMLAKPPENAYDPNGPKAPGQPGPDDGYFPPKGGPNWVPNPNPGGGGSSWGWEDKKGDVWCPTGQGGRSHSGPHWDVQTPGGDYRNVKPKR